MNRRLSIIIIVFVVVLLFIPVYWLAHFIFGPWDLFTHIVAKTTSVDGKLKAEVYRKGFGYSWSAYYRVMDEGGLIVDRRFAGFDMIDEPELHFNSIRIDGNDLVIGPHADHNSHSDEYYRFPIYIERSLNTLDTKNHS